MYCPECKQKFDEEVTECPEHHIALVDELPFQSIEGPSSTWVEIASVTTMDEARILQGFLEAEGIPCQVESLKFSTMPVDVGDMSEIRIYVTADNETAALDLLEERDEEYETIGDEEERVMTDEGPADIADDAEAVSDTEE